MHVILNFLVAIQMLAAIGMIGLILVQHGKGADMGAAFGSGSAGSLFGASGSANFLSRTTAVLAVVFFACTLLLAYLGYSRPSTTGDSLLERAAVGAGAPAPVPAPASQIPTGNAPAAPAAPAPAPAAPAESAPAPASGGAGQIPAK